MKRLFVMVWVCRVLATPAVGEVHLFGAAADAWRLNEAAIPVLKAGARVQVPLPGGRSTPVVVHGVEQWAGSNLRLAGAAGGSGSIDFTFVSTGDAVAGSLHLGPGEAYVYRGAVGKIRVAAVDPASLPPCGGGMPLPQAMHGDAVTGPEGAAADTTVDVAVVYTPQARNAEGGDAAMRAAIEAAVLQANTVFSNSQLNVAYRLVYAGEVAYDDSGDMNTDLNRITNNGDVYLDDIHCLRNRYGADLVSLVVESGQYGGLAWIMCTPGSGFENQGFSVVARDSLPFYVLAHEFGHNFGCDHDPDNLSSCRAHAYSRGYRFTNDVYLNKTVMAYDPGFTVGHFSNPDVTFFGTPTGVENVADNARTMEQTLGIVAAFRSLSPPATPTGVSATGTTTNSVRIAWNEVCAATGYRVLKNGQPIGATGTTYFDEVGASATACYSVIATNPAGASPVSAQVCGGPTTQPPFLMDGVFDHAGYLLSDPGMTIYAAVRTNRLYVATWSPGHYPGDTTRNDHFLFVADALLPAASAPAPWAKAGLVAAASTQPFLGAESTTDYIGWFNTAGSTAAIKTWRNGGQMEGSFDLMATFGGIPPVLYFASAAYATLDGGGLAAQAPAGSGPNLDPGEFLAVPVEALIDRNADGAYDRLDPAFDFVAYSVTADPEGRPRLSWASMPGRVYRIDRTPSPVGGAWSTRSVVTAGVLEVETTWIDTQPSATAAVYRILHLP